MGDFNYNAPQYIDFNSPAELELQDFGEEYFDMDHEIELEFNETLKDSEEYSEARYSSNPDLSTRVNDNVVTVENSDDNRPKLRRSVSAGSIITTPVVPSKTTSKTTSESNSGSSLIQAFDNLILKSAQKNPKNRRMNGLSILPSKSLVVKSEQPRRLQNPIASSRDAIHKLGMPSYKSDKLKRKMSTESLNSIQPNKYISVAEAVQQFQFKTPQRFHTHSTKTQFNNGGNSKLIALRQTIPNSPALATKTRSRSREYLGHDAQLLKEAEEMKKHQIKARPVNYKILRAAVIPPKPEVHATQPEPFKFTEVKYNHAILPSKDLYEFHARPAPKTTAPGAIGIPVSRRSMMPKLEIVKKPPTPTFRRKYDPEAIPSVCESGNNVGNRLNIKKIDLHHDGMLKDIIQKPIKTELKPFSFEARNKKMLERKEQKIKEYLENEKKAREFHARPIPIKVNGQCKKIESKVVKLISESSSGSLSDPKINDYENIEPPCFKARPATVIHKKPFVPKKEERPLLEIQEFTLSFNYRAKEREEFDKKIKEKVEEVEHLKKEGEEHRKKMEEEEIKRLRKEIVHKANPIKAYKPIEILPSTKKVTSPKSPFKSQRKLNETTK